MIYDISYIIYDILYIIYDIWCMIYDIWCIHTYIHIYMYTYMMLYEHIIEPSILQMILWKSVLYMIYDIWYVMFVYIDTVLCICVYIIYTNIWVALPFSVFGVHLALLGVPLGTLGG